MRARRQCESIQRKAHQIEQRLAKLAERSSSVLRMKRATAQSDRERAQRGDPDRRGELRTFQRVRNADRTQPTEHVDRQEHEREPQGCDHERPFGPRLIPRTRRERDSTEERNQAERHKDGHAHDGSTGPQSPIAMPSL